MIKYKYTIKRIVNNCSEEILMNFKKTCKSIVSFVLGTGMMFSGLAFNSHPNAFFSEKVLKEKKLEFKDDPNMKLLLTSLWEVQNNREKLRDTVSEERIYEAGNTIVTAYKEFEKEVTEYIETQETIKKTKEECNYVLYERAQNLKTIAQLVTLSSQNREKIDTATKQIEQKVASILNANKMVEQELEQVVAEKETAAEDIEKAIQENEKARKELEAVKEQVTIKLLSKHAQQELLTNIQAKENKISILWDTDNDMRAKLGGLISECALHASKTITKLCQLISYLMTLSISSSDESTRLCLDNLAPHIQTLFGENSTELKMHIRDAAHKLFGEINYEEVA